MLKFFGRNIRRLFRRLRWPLRRQSKAKVVVRKFGKTGDRAETDGASESVGNGSAVVHPNGQLDGVNKSGKQIRIATFNAALFSMAPAVPVAEESGGFSDENGDSSALRSTQSFDLQAKSANDRPKSILKQSPLHPNSMNGTENLSKQQKLAKPKLRVSINLPDNEISLLRHRQLSFSEYEKEDLSSSNNAVSRILGGKPLLRSITSLPSYSEIDTNGEKFKYRRTVVEVLRELDADILALQDVKAEEEKAMKPLSDLASALGMNYVFAESWAPEYGNAVLSKWPIKRSKVQKIFDDSDFRNVLKVTVDIPHAGEVNLYCTHLDHLDENWRMKQINSIIQSSNEPHILVGGLNSLDETDYSQERWTDIVKYYEEMGKPTPKAEVMKFLKEKHYADGKEFAGECESVVMIAKGQSVQGTCKYGTRVDYILASPNSPYKFVPGSYSVFSSKGTSDHHIVKVDINKENFPVQCDVSGEQSKQRQRVVKITNSSPSPCIWKTPT